jgi:hypothetical protein
MSWKELEERNTTSQFVKYCGVKTLTNGDIVQYFNCSRSGVYHSAAKPSENSDRQRNLKKSGTRKIQLNCTASITLVINSKGYSVQYCSTHIGHQQEIDHLTRPMRESLLNGTVY